MSEFRDVAPISSLTGMTVLSLATGNKLGKIANLFIDPVNGVLLGATLSAAGGGVVGLGHQEIFSFGRDAVMAKSDQSVVPMESGVLDGGRDASKIVGAKIITDSGDLLGQITDVYVTLKPPPRILYEARQSMLDKLLGRQFFVPADLAHALSDDSARLVVPDITTEVAASNIGTFVDQYVEVHGNDNIDDTIPVLGNEDATLVQFGEDDDTVLRRPRSA